MNQSTQTITLKELLTTYLDSLRAQVHPVMTDQVQKTLESFEAALRVKVPRDLADVPESARPLFMLFRSTVDSLLAVRTPASGFLESGLIVTRLEASGENGRKVLDLLQFAGEQASALRQSQLEALELLFRIFIGGAQPSVTMDDVRATGLYPGDTPKDFDIYDHM